MGAKYVGNLPLIEKLKY